MLAVYDRNVPLWHTFLGESVTTMLFRPELHYNRDVLWKSTIHLRRKTELKGGLKLCSHPRTHFLFLYPSLHSSPEGREMSRASLIKWLRGKKRLLLEEENESHQPGKRGLSPPHYAQSGAWLVWVSENKPVQMSEAAMKGCLLRHTQYLTGLITGGYGSLLRSGVSTQ